MNSSLRSENGVEKLKQTKLEKTLDPKTKEKSIDCTYLRIAVSGKSLFNPATYPNGSYTVNLHSVQNFIYIVIEV